MFHFSPIRICNSGSSKLEVAVAVCGYQTCTGLVVLMDEMWGAGGFQRFVYNGCILKIIWVNFSVCGTFLNKCLPTNRIQTDYDTVVAILALEDRENYVDSQCTFAGWWVLGPR